MHFFDVHEKDSPFIYHAPHGGTMIPDGERAHFVVGQSHINEEILHMTDWLTEIMAEEISEQYGSSSFVNHVSRLVCDPERFPDAREEMEKVGMGFAYTHGAHRDTIRAITTDDKERIKSKFYDPYAKAFSELVNRKLSENGIVCIIDIHSYSSKALPYELNPNEVRPEICIGVDRYHQNIDVLGAVIASLETEYEVALNSPFSGSYIPLEHYGKTPEVLSLMFEIRRDIYMDEATGFFKEEGFNKLLQTLGEVQKVIEQKILV